MKLKCNSCKNVFESEEVSPCPACSSKKVIMVVNQQASAPEIEETKPVASALQEPKIIRDGKEGWKDFHQSDLKACLKCGGTEFEYNWKHKEKHCKKCGEIIRLPRRMG
jgi:DNA-directed RNA polymerase subunit RPC12/RpoP